MEILMLGLVILSLIINIVCAVIVALGINEKHGIIWALLGFFCCGIGVYIWGWIAWQSPYKLPVMGAWTVGIILSMIANAGAAVLTQ